MGRCIPAGAMVFMTLLHPEASGQVRHNTWFFGGNAGISFSTGAPVAFSGSVMNAFEGCTAISDLNGDPLFYTDCITVFDRTNAPMPNGTGMAGNTSSAQGALVVPYPSDPDRYYLFTTPSQAGQFSGQDLMTWSEIDMTLNGGLGDVTVLKNIPLLQGAAEQMKATYHANGKDVWVLVRKFNTDEWYAYRVSCTGIDAPVVSHAGRALRDSNPNDTQAALGFMDITAAGDRIASTWNDYPGEVSYLELLRFDNSTGVVSDGTFTTRPSPEGSSTAYGVCFSPNDQVLYWSFFGVQSRLTQFDLSAADPFATEQIIATNVILFGCPQRGRDGKVYLPLVNGNQFLACVQDPNVVGTGCGFVLQAVSTAPGYCSQSLSNDWIRTELPLQEEVVFAWTDSTTCRPSLDLTVPDTWLSPVPPHIRWSTGSTGTTLVVNASGTYGVELAYACDTVRDTVHVTISDRHITLAPDPVPVLCAGEEIVLSAPPGFTAYQWSSGGTGIQEAVRSAGTYWLDAVDAIGCPVTDTLTVVAGPCACGVYVPNAFTPNGDGINDAFQPVSTCAFRSFELRVFDRWGRELFTADGPENVWSGDGTPIGVYAWTIKYDRWDNNTEHRSTLFGTITLVR